MKLDISEGTVFGKQYQIAKPIINDAAYDHSSTWDNMLYWCIDTFGTAPQHGVWEADGRWYVNNAKFWFRDQEDFSLFVLKWA